MSEVTKVKVFCPNEKCENHTAGWYPRVRKPKFCPRCKRAIPTAAELQAKAEALEEIETVDAYTEQGYTPGCCVCQRDAVFRYKKKFYCLECGIEFLRKDLDNE